MAKHPRPWSIVPFPRRPRLPLRLLGALLLGLSSAASPGTASIAVPGAPGIRVIPPSEVIRDHTRSLPSGVLLFQSPDGAEVPLIRDPADPQISNPGDGAFYPVDESVVLAALSDLPADFLAPLQVDIYLLPYPRSGMLASSADTRAIYLTPGVRPYEPGQIHFVVTHEIGHCVHRHFLPDGDAAGWSAWARLRGVADATVYNAGAAHRDRPHEIFAEDFRVLFGGSLARGDGSIENRDLDPPDDVPGLRAFYLGLIGTGVEAGAVAWRLGPNPLRDQSQVSLFAPGAGSRPVRPTLYDVSGRMLGQPAVRSAGSGMWRLDLRDGGGRALPAGAYWLRFDDGGVGTVVLPFRVLR